MRIVQHSLVALSMLSLTLVPAVADEPKPTPPNPNVEAPAAEAEKKPERPPSRGEAPSPKRERPDRSEGTDRPERPEPGPRVPRFEAREGERPGRSGGPGREAHGPREGKMRTWLGIATTPIDSALREHLELPEGFGVQIAEAMPDSPAATAGLRKNDILVRFEDQRLISPEHLALLVRAQKEGDRVSLAIVRKGREETVEVVLGETHENQFGPFGPDGHSPEGFPMPPRFDRDPSHWQETIRKHQDYWQDWMDEHRPGWREHPDREGGHPRRPRSDGPERQEGRPPSVSVSPGFPLRVFGSEGVLKIDNEQGELTLTRKGDDHTLVIEDASGKVVYDGPFDPAKGVESLPEAARKQLETMKLGNFEVKLPETPSKQPEKTTAPPNAAPSPENGPDEIL